jgi:hypothetical protein
MLAYNTLLPPPRLLLLYVFLLLLLPFLWYLLDLCTAGSCNYRGTCNSTTGICTCDAGWTGATCNVEEAGACVHEDALF